MDLRCDRQSNARLMKPELMNGGKDISFKATITNNSSARRGLSWRCRRGCENLSVLGDQMRTERQERIKNRLRLALVTVDHRPVTQSDSHEERDRSEKCWRQVNQIKIADRGVNSDCRSEPDGARKE